MAAIRLCRAIQGQLAQRLGSAIHAGSERHGRGHRIAVTASLADSDVLAIGVGNVRADQAVRCHQFFKS